MGYLLGIVLALAVGVFAYLLIGPQAVIPTMLVTLIFGVSIAFGYMLRMLYLDRTSGQRMLQLLQTRPLAPSDETALDPIMDEPVSGIAANSELAILVEERLAQWKVWHPYE